MTTRKIYESNFTIIPKGTQVKSLKAAEEFQSNVVKTENTSIWISVAVCKKQEFQEQREDFDNL